MATIHATAGNLYMECFFRQTVTIGVIGATAPQFQVTTGSTLTISGMNPVVLNLPAGFGGTVAGNIVFKNAAHQMTATDTGSLTFANGSVFTAGTGFSGTPFGVTAIA